MIKNQKTRKIVILGSTIIGTPVLYVTIIWSIFVLATYYPKHEFDSEKWKNEKRIRYELTNDLITSELLLGKSKKEVEQLLGETSKFERNEWVYDVGFIPGMFNIDIDIIEISFKNNKVTNVKQRST